MRLHANISGAMLAITLCAAVCSAATAAQPEPATLSFATAERAIEASSVNVTLPSGVGSSLVVTPCAGCAPTLLRATATTTYFLHKQKVTLGNLKAAIGGHAVAVTVVGSIQTHELTRVIANLDTPVPAPASTPAAAPVVRKPVRK